MEKSWGEVARVLGASPRRGDRRHDDARMEAYLALNELVEEPDTTSRMDAITRVLPHLVRGFHMDLVDPSADVVPMCLRALSYFMYHEHISSLFSLEMVQSTIDAIIHVVHNTTDQTVYLLCVWCLTKQNFDEHTHQLVPRIVDVFCLACMNELQSQKIHLHGLFGLHTILVKHATALVSRDMVTKWCHVAAKALCSSDKDTRDASRRIFDELSMLQLNDGAADDVVARCIETFAVPAMHQHMVSDRPLEAIHVWGFVVVLLRAKLAHDDDLLNATFKVPEVTLRHPDSRVRIASLQHWRSVVGIFRTSPQAPSSTPNGLAADTVALWLLRNAIVDVVMRPLVVCFRDEALATVLSAACDTWHNLIAVAVADFNAYCRAVAPLTMETCKIVMRNSWKLWWEDMVTQVLVVLARRIHQTGDAIYVVLRDRTHGLVRRMWHVDQHDADASETCNDNERDDASAMGKSIESLSLTNSPLPRAMVTAVETLVYQEQSIAMLVMFQSTVHCISTLRSIDPSDANRSVVLALWHGMVRRLETALMVHGPIVGEAAEVRKLFRRLLTKCCAFMFGCTQFQAKSAASLRDPETAALVGADVALRHRMDLLELVVEKLDVRCFQYVLTESSGQLQQALEHKAAAVLEELRRAAHADEANGGPTKVEQGDDALQWLRNEFVSDGRVTSVLELVGYTMILDLLMSMPRGRQPSHASTGCIVAVNMPALAMAMATIFDKFCAFEIVPPASRHVFTTASHVLQSMAQALERHPYMDDTLGRLAPSIPSFASEFRSKWTAYTRRCDRKVDAPIKADTADSMSSMGSLPSPCLLQKRASLASDGHRKRHVSSVGDHEGRLASTTPPVEPRRSDAIRPDLVECKEPFALIKHHFPPSFRQLAGFFNIHTIGDLCAKTEADVAAMSLHDPVNTVHKALDEFVGRRERLNTLANKSPMKRKLPVAPFGAAAPQGVDRPSRSPKRRLKSAMRSLAEDVMLSDDGQTASAKIADVVKFSVLGPDGSVRVIRPGEDSQSMELDATKGSPPERSPDVPQPCDVMGSDSKLIALAAKVVSHLERCDAYVEKIKAQILLGRRTSHQPTACWTIDARTTIGAALVEANGIMAKMARDIGTLMEPSAQSSSSFEMSGAS